MSTKDIIDDLLDEIKTEVMAGIAIANIADFDLYVGDTPTNASQKQLAVYFDNKTNDGSQEDFSFIVQAQLNGVSTRESWDYQDIVESALKNVNPELVGYESRQRISIENYPIFENDSTIILFEVLFSKSIDDCNFNS